MRALLSASAAVAGANVLHDSCRPRLELRRRAGYRSGEIDLVNPCPFAVTYSDGSYIDRSLPAKSPPAFRSLLDLIRDRKSICFIPWSGMNCLEIQKEHDWTTAEMVPAGKSLQLVQAGFGMARQDTYDEIYIQAKKMACCTPTVLRVKCCPIPAFPALGLWYDLPLEDLQVRGKSARHRPSRSVDNLQDIVKYYS
jgi:hypothetical protein